MQESNLIKVNQARLWHRHMRLGQIGATPAGGVNRQAMTEGDGEARTLLIQWGSEAGLQASMDPIGNLFLRRAGDKADTAPILTGSHLDTQPAGGKFDGAFGVLAALEALTAFNEAGITTTAPVELVVWNNEEGCRYAPTTMGSAVFCGALDLDQALATTDSDGIAVASALANLAQPGVVLAQRPLGFPVAGYLEAHIEQGPLLEQAGCPIGVVDGIQGLRWFTVDVRGQAGHAGTTPHAGRRDALVAALAMLRALQAHFYDADDSVRFTVGRMQVSPNAPNTIPERVRFTIDFRHPQMDVLTRLGDAVEDVCRRAAGVCDVDVTESPASPPIRFDAGVIAVLKEVSQLLNVPHRTLSSGATHDAKWLSGVAPSGMIFVPCEDGISHNEREAATADALAAGAAVLANALMRMANANNQKSA